MNPDAPEPTILSRFLRRLFLTQQRQTKRDRRRNDHQPRGGAEKHKRCRKMAAASRRRNRQ